MIFIDISFVCIFKCHSLFAKSDRLKVSSSHRTVSVLSWSLLFRSQPGLAVWVSNCSPARNEKNRPNVKPLTFYDFLFLRCVFALICLNGQCERKLECNRHCVFLRWYGENNWRNLFNAIHCYSQLWAFSSSSKIQKMALIIFKQILNRNVNIFIRKVTLLRSNFDCASVVVF